MREKRYEILLWDLDDTLLDFHKSEDVALKKTFSYFHLELTKERLKKYLEINAEGWKQLSLSKITNREVLVGRWERFFQYFSITGITPEEMQNRYREDLGSVFFYLEDSFALCKELGREFRQFIVTNGTCVTQKKKLHLSGFDTIMENVFISEEIGANKPEREFFTACFKKIPQFDKRKALLIGDNLVSDIQGGILSGIDTCWYHGKKVENHTDFIPTYEITSLKELTSLLWKS